TDQNVVHAQVAPADPERHGGGRLQITVAAHRSEVEMRLSRAAGVADASDDLSRTDRLAERHGNAALFRMCKQNPRAPASKHHVIARRMGEVHRAWRVIGQLALTLLDSSLARA